MRNRKTQITSAIALILALMLVLSLFIGALPVAAHAVTQDEIDELQDELDAIREKRDEKQAEVDELKSQQNTAMAQKIALEERNEYTKRQIQLSNDQIKLYQDMIEEKGKEVDTARALEEEQLLRYRSRVRSMEENGTMDYLAFILQAKSLSELIAMIDDIAEIMQSDRLLEAQYVQARENTEKVKADYEAVKVELEAKLDELNAEKKKLEKDIAETQIVINDLLVVINEQEAELAAIEALEDAASAAVDELIAQREKEKKEEEERRRQEELKKQNSGNSSGGSSGGGGGTYVTGSGTFRWPVPSCTYITSRVGNRWHPISGLWKYHSGLDIGAAFGSAIVAADSGEVILAEWYGGYGNCIMIDHGNGYYTLYGHLSEYAVSEGDSVSKGQTIAFVGSTGNSTGPHLHFEIRYGDTIYDPEPYYPDIKFTYAADAGD